MTLLREREFRSFWLAQSVSLLGDQIALIALPLVAVLVLDAGPGQMGLLGAAALLPHLLFSLPAGVWLDRVARRRRVLIAADLGRAAIVATVPLAHARDALSLGQLYGVAFLSGSLAVAFDLSYPTVFVSLTSRERYMEANSLIHGSRSFSYVAGPSIGGLLVQAFSAPFALLADAVSFLVSAAFLRRVRAEEPSVEPEGKGFRATRSSCSTRPGSSTSAPARWVSSWARGRSAAFSARPWPAAWGGRSASGEPSCSGASSSRRRSCWFRSPRARRRSCSGCSSSPSFSRAWAS